MLHPRKEAPASSSLGVGAPAGLVPEVAPVAAQVAAPGLAPGAIPVVGAPKTRGPAAPSAPRGPAPREPARFRYTR